jgi:hypothetical protein
LSSSETDLAQEEMPFSWNKAFLAIIPGLFATAGLVRSDFSTWMLVGLTLLVAFLFFAYWRNSKRLPAWSLMAAGMLTSIGLTIASGVIGGLASLLMGGLANAFVLLILLAALLILLVASRRDLHLSPLTWIILAVIIACQLTTRIKYFVYFGVSWPVAGQWLNISLYAAVIALLLPAAIGIRLTRHYGLPAMLFLIGMIYMGFQILIDVNHKVSNQMGVTLGFILYKAVIPFVFTVIAPLWFMRAPSSRGRVGGLLGLIGLAILLDLVIVGWAYNGTLPLIIWISFIPYVASVLLTFILVYLQISRMDAIRFKAKPEMKLETPS